MEGYWTIGLVLDFLLVTKFLLTFLEFLLVVLTSSGAGIISGGAGITLVESLILHKVNNIENAIKIVVHWCAMDHSSYVI